jgi:ribonuclease HI
MVKIYTDGACISGAGGWAWVRVNSLGQIEERQSGAQADTTNNQMELEAAIQGIEASSPTQLVQVISDSRYVVDGASLWLKNWKRRGWTLKGGGQVKNMNWWLRIDALQKTRAIEWRWVKGHAGDGFNELCDRLANEQAEQQAGQVDYHQPFWAKPRRVK